MNKIAIVVTMFAFGCLNSQVAKGTDTSYKRAAVERAGLIEYGEWNYAKFKSVGEGKMYAIKIDKEDGRLTAHCMETVYTYHKDSYGPFDESVPWQKCTSELVISTLKQIEDPE